MPRGDGFCEKLNGLSAAAAKAKPDDTAEAIQDLQAWVAEMEDYEAPSELSDEQREGFEILVATFEKVEDDSSIEDLQTPRDQHVEGRHREAERVQRLDHRELHAGPAVGRRLLRLALTWVASDNSGRSARSR